MTRKRHKAIDKKKMRRECWQLDSSFLKWLYPRIVTYKQEAYKIIDGSYPKFTIDGEDYTQEECVDMILDLLKPLADKDFDFWDKSINKNDIHKAINIFNEILFSLWW